MGWSGDGWSLTPPTSSDISDFDSGVASALNATGSAPIYAARAWVNFNGNSNTLLTGLTYVRTGFIVVINFGTSNPGLSSGDWIYFDSSSGTAADGLYQLSAVGMSGSDYTATFTHAASSNTNGNCQLQRMAIRGSGNISSIADTAAGDYYANFSTDLPDANYAVVGRASLTDAAGNGNGRYVHSWPAGRNAHFCRIQCDATSALQDGVSIDVVFYG